MPFLDQSVVYNEESEELVIFAVNRSLDTQLLVDVDIRSFEGYKLAEQIVLKNENPKAVNSINDEQVKPEKGNDSYIENGTLTAVLPKMSWNMFRLKELEV